MDYFGGFIVLMHVTLLQQLLDITSRTATVSRTNYPQNEQDMQTSTGHKIPAVQYL